MNTLRESLHYLTYIQKLKVMLLILLSMKMTFLNLYKRQVINGVSMDVFLAWS